MDSTQVFVVLALSFVLVIPCPSECRLCCDPNCNSPISYGRTQQRYITREHGFLSYPQSAIVTVLAKGAHLEENGEEFWEAEIQGKKGLISSSAVNEMTYKCTPQEFFAAKDTEEQAIDDGRPGGDDGQPLSPPPSDEGSPTEQVNPDQPPPPVYNEEEKESMAETPPSAGSSFGDGMERPEETSQTGFGDKNVVNVGQTQPPGDDGRQDEQRVVSIESSDHVEEREGRMNVDRGNTLQEEQHHINHFEQKEEPSENSFSDQNYEQQDVNQAMPIPPPMVAPTPPVPPVTPEMLATLSPRPSKEETEQRVQEERKVTFVDGVSDQLHVQGNLPPHPSQGDDSAGNDDTANQRIESDPGTVGRAGEDFYSEREFGGNLAGSTDSQNELDSRDVAKEDVNTGKSVDREEGDEDFYSEEHRDDDHFARDQFEHKPTDNDRPPVKSVHSDQTDKEDDFDSEENKMEDRREDGYGGGGGREGNVEGDKWEGDQEEEDDDDDYDDDSYWDDVEEPRYTSPDVGQKHGEQLTGADEKVWQKEQLPPEQASDDEDEDEAEEEEKESFVVDKEKDDGGLEETITPTSQLSETEAPPSFNSATWPTETPPPDVPHANVAPPAEALPPDEALPSDATPTNEPPSSYVPPSDATPTNEAPPLPHDGTSEQIDRVTVSTFSRVENIDHQSHGVHSESHLSLHPSTVDEINIPTGGHLQSSQPPLPPQERQEEEQVGTFEPSGTVIDGTTYPPDAQVDGNVIQTTHSLHSHDSTPVPASTPIPDSDSNPQEERPRTMEQNADEGKRAMDDFDRYHRERRRDLEEEDDNDDDDRTPDHLDKRAGFDSDDYQGSQYQGETVIERQPEATPTTTYDVHVESIDVHSHVTDYGAEVMPNPGEATPTQEPTIVDQSQPSTGQYYSEDTMDKERVLGTDVPIATPTAPPTAPPTYSSFEEPPPPPSASYSCHDDYVPMPGHDGGGWMAYHEKVRGQVRDIILRSLPEAWSNWVCQNRPMMGVVFTSIACFSLVAPLLMLWCLSGRSGRQKIRQVQLKLANYRKLEEDLSKAQNDKSVVERKLRESDDQRQDMQGKMSLQKQDYDRVTREKGEIEAHYQSVTGALTKAQQEISQYLANTEQLNGQIASLQSQVTAVMTEREGALQQSTNLSAVIQDLESKVQALEAQKDQLEEDRFTSQTALQELQAQHEQVTDELQKTAEERAELRNDLSSTTSELEAKMASISEMDEELQTLRSCLSQLTEQAATGEEGEAREEIDTGGEGEVEEEEREAVGGVKRTSQLEKIQAMLDTTKVQLELRATTEERDHLLAELKEKTTNLEQQIADNEQLNTAYTALETKEQATSFKLKELELKMKGVKEYFQEKERELHKRIEVGEVSRLRYEQLESEAQEKASIADQERQREKKELVELRDQISDIEKSYSSQIKNTEMRAGDAIASLRRTEQELRQANREITSLRRRLSEFENAPLPPSRSVVRPIPAHAPSYVPGARTRPPSTGPAPPRDMAYQPPRPISAPRLDPRTSSPTGSETAGPLPSLPPAMRVPPGGFHKSQSSAAVLNTSLPPLGTPSSRVEDRASDVSFPGQAPSSMTSLTGSQPAAAQTHGEQRSGTGERLLPGRQAQPPQAYPPSAAGRPPLKTPPIPRGGPTPPPGPGGRPMPPPPQSRVPPYSGYPPQSYPPPPGGRMHRGPPPASSGHPYPPPPGGPYPPAPRPRQPMAPPTARGHYPPPNSGMIPPRPRVRTPGPPPPGSYSDRPGPPGGAWQQQAPPPPRNAPPTRPPGEVSGVIQASHTEADVV